jgi:2,3-bisphosphoglycerate-independent phosphoglycerate mutase
LADVLVIVERDEIMKPDFLSKFIQPASTKIVMLILDGLGGLPQTPGGLTELETAHTPNLDQMASQSSLGLTIPVMHGITNGSGPGHLAIFGYDPIEYEIGRGALEALGVDFDLRPKDVAARGNFCLVDKHGVLIDRRGGRIPTDQSRELVTRLNEIRIEGVEFFLETVKEHRLAFVMRGEGLSSAISDSDPQKNGVQPYKVHALKPEGEKSARIVNQFIEEARHLLQGETTANMITLRGYDCLPTLPPYSEKFGLKAAAIVINGMYKGVARLAGMEVLEVEGWTLEDQLRTLETHWNDFDFFYLHVKQTDICGEMGDFDGKVRVIEEVDGVIPQIMALHPDVVIVGGDHSTPAVMKAHSWHPVPVMIHSKFVRPDQINQFGERACQHGSLGVLPATQIMPIALANAGRIAKYGG